MIAVNGLILKKLTKQGELRGEISPEERKNSPIANIFFRLYHKDPDGIPLINKYQSALVEAVH